MINDHKTQGTWRIHYPGNKIIEHKTQSQWKIQLTMLINFISSKSDSDETRIMRAKSDEIDEIDEVIKEILDSLLKRYQKGLEDSVDGSDFTFDGVNALYYDLNTVSLSSGKLYIDSPKWLKNKKGNNKSKK